jgi:hypothetical protein
MNLLDDALGLLLVSMERHRYRGTAAGELQCDGAADAPASARHGCDAAGETGRRARHAPTTSE